LLFCPSKHILFNEWETWL
jgi:KH domain